MRVQSSRIFCVRIEGQSLPRRYRSRGRVARRAPRAPRLPHSVAEYRIRDRWLRIEERRTADGGSLGIRVDITDLKNSEESFRLLFDSNPLADVHPRHRNQGHHQRQRLDGPLYGYSREQLLGMSIRNLLIRDDREQAVPRFHQSERHDWRKPCHAASQARRKRHQTSYTTAGSSGMRSYCRPDGYRRCHRAARAQPKN